MDLIDIKDYESIDSKERLLVVKFIIIFIILYAFYLSVKFFILSLYFLYI